MKSVATIIIPDPKTLFSEVRSADRGESCERSGRGFLPFSPWGVQGMILRPTAEEERIQEELPRIVS